jgi:hypothetical protein
VQDIFSPAFSNNKEVLKSFSRQEKKSIENRLAWLFHAPFYFVPNSFVYELHEGIGQALDGDQEIGNARVEQLVGYGIMSWIMRIFASNDKPQ